MAYTLRPLRGGFDWRTVTGLLHDAATTDGWICWSFSNHDVERAISRWHQAADPAFARMLMMLHLSLRGSVCLYQGEELGLTEARLSQADLRDPFGMAHWPDFRGRDGSRTPLPWQRNAPQAGFTTARTPWLPIPQDHHALAVDAQEADPGSLLHAFRNFIAWRRTVPALLYGSLTPLDLADPLVGFTREYEGQRITAVFNLSDRAVRAPQPFGASMPPFGVLFTEADAA